MRSIAMQDTLGRLAARKVRLALVDQLLPKRVADALVQRAVAHDGKRRAFGATKTNAALRRLVPMRSELAELTLGPLERVDVAVGNNADGDASGRAVFGLANRARDGLALRARHGLKFTVGAFSAPACAWK